MKLHPVVEELISVFESEKVPSKHGSGPSVSRTVSAVAVLYERARNAVEFQAEHLVRKAAIERILKRRTLISDKAPAIAENLILELFWANYIDTSLIDDEKAKEIEDIISRYLKLRWSMRGNGNGISWDFLVGIASSEIHEAIFPDEKRQAIVNFFYQAIRNKIQVSEVDEQDVNVRTFIAIERAFAKADNSLISFHLLKMAHPDWFAPTSHKKLDNVELIATLSSIRSSLSHPLVGKLHHYIRTQMPPFLLLQDFLFETEGEARDYIEDTKELGDNLRELATKRYRETSARIRRAVVRSFVYIFTTKMVFVLALELPYDLYIAKEVSYLPLFANTIFPPFLLALMAGFFKVPGKENTKVLVNRVKKILYEFDNFGSETEVFTAKEKKRNPIMSVSFTLLYVAAYGITFGIIYYVLSLLKFNTVSQMVFIFFVAIVAFFAQRIRESAKEYDLLNRQGVLSPIVDFFLLPILKLGRALSLGIARLNVITFVLDLVLEAPLKGILKVVEEWIHYIRTKKEEII